jgi:hypothetical protein
MPGAGRIRAAIDGGPLKGGAPRVVWQALDADPRTVSAGLAAQRLDRLGRASHLVWNPVNGEIVQLIPILRAGRSLGWPDGLNPGALPAPDASAIWKPARQAAAETAKNWPGEAAGGTAPDVIAEVNAEGRLCVQVGVVAFAWDPFTSRPMTGLQQILDWLDSWGIPRQWPGGQPAASALGSWWPFRRLPGARPDGRRTWRGRRRAADRLGRPEQAVHQGRPGGEARACRHVRVPRAASGRRRRGKRVGGLRETGP